MLTTKGFIDDINKPNTSAHVLDTTKYITSRFLRHHFHQDLKIFEQDPCKFWIALKINLEQSFCQKHGTSSHYFALWSSNLSQNPILQYKRFVASFSFVIIIDDAEMIENSLSIFFLFQIGYCNSNTIEKTTPNILISYLTYSK